MNTARPLIIQEKIDELKKDNNLIDARSVFKCKLMFDNMRQERVQPKTTIILVDFKTRTITRREVINNE